MCEASVASVTARGIFDEYYSIDDLWNPVPKYRV